jgi:thymidine kinase
VEQESYPLLKNKIKFFSMTHRHGRLILITGPMGAGKTTGGAVMISKYGRVENNALFMVYNPLDTRSTFGEFVTTHDGIIKIKATYFCVPLDASTKRPDLSAVIIPANITHVFLDEVQFYGSDQIEDVVVQKWVRAQHLVVMCAGLITDKNRDFWPATLMVQKYADEHIALSSLCKCGCPAGHTKAIKDAATVTVGGMDKYEAVCVNCH